MTVPFVFVPHPATKRNSVKKEIVYSDTILNFGKEGKSLKICEIEEIEEFQLDDCLNTIFQNNEDVMFHTIQYSKNGKKIFLYTDKEVNIKCWTERRIDYMEHYSATSIFEFIDTFIESSSKTNHDGMYSLDDIKVAANKIRKDIKKRLEILEETIESTIESSDIGSYEYASVHIWHGSQDLTVSLHDRFFKRYDDVTFALKDDDIYIKKSEADMYSDQILEAIGAYAREILTIYKKVNELEFSYKIFNPVEMHIDLKFNLFFYFIYYKEERLNFNYDFDDCKFKCDINSLKSIEFMKARMPLLFKVTYIPSDKIPEIIITEIEKAAEISKNTSCKKGWLTNFFKRLFSKS